MRGLKKIGRIAREVLKARSSLQPHPSTSTNSTLVTSSTTQLSSHASSSSSSTDFSEPVTLSVEAQNAICDIKDKFSLRGEFIRDEPVSPRTKSTPSAMDKSDSRVSGIFCSLCYLSSFYCTTQHLAILFRGPSKSETCAAVASNYVWSSLSQMDLSLSPWCNDIVPRAVVTDKTVYS